MLGNTVNRRTRILTDLLALIAAVALCVAGWAFYDRFHDTNKRRAELAAIDRRNCQSIESLKDAQRKEAWISFNRLREDAKILGIPVTRQLLDTAKKRRDEKIARFRRLPCPPAEGD